MLVQKVIAPNVGPLAARLDDMTAAAASGQVSAFVHGVESGRSRLVARRILPSVCRSSGTTHDLGVKVLVAHEGLPLRQLGPGVQSPRRHRRRLAPVPRHAVRRLPWRLGSESSGRAL